MKRVSSSLSRRPPPQHVIAAGAVLGVLAGTAIINAYFARSAERHNRRGRFITVDGVRLHYIERGSGEPLVLFHGNGTMMEDLISSGLVAEAQDQYRVIVFDRPGFGHSSRPRNVIWTARAQAELFNKALLQLNVPPAIVLGHSWGASVAMALAVFHPEVVKGVVLASGYYYPTPRVDVAFLGAPSVPILGDILSYTVSPVAARLLWPRIKKKMFGPQRAPDKFDRVPTEMIFRPSQLRAGAAEAALMIPDAAASENHYSHLTMPVAIVAGEEDQIVNIDEQSARLHEAVAHSTFSRLAGAGHMIHQTETAAVLNAIDEVSKAGVTEVEGSSSRTRLGFSKPIAI